MTKSNRIHELDFNKPPTEDLFDTDKSVSPCMGHNKAIGCSKNSFRKNHKTEQTKIIIFASGNEDRKKLSRMAVYAGKKFKHYHGVISIYLG